MSERTETEKQKNDRRRQEATVYRVENDFGKASGTYRLSKRTLDVEVEVYHVTVKDGYDGDGDEGLWCTCPGFKRQQFALRKHKHVRAVRDYIKRGAPAYVDYRFVGAGKNTKIRYVGQSDEEK